MPICETMWLKVKSPCLAISRVVHDKSLANEIMTPLVLLRLLLIGVVCWQSP